jgi:hypothetical protein
MRGDAAIEIAPGRYVAPWLVLGIVCIAQFIIVLDRSSI